MNCPRCNTNLEKMMASPKVEVDACKDGCGGIWLDNLEIKKLDEKSEVDQQLFIKLAESKTKSPDLNPRIKCPKCMDIVMMRHFANINKDIVIDECAKCGGWWLDIGELEKISEEFPTEAAHEAAAQSS